MFSIFSRRQKAPSWNSTSSGPFKKFHGSFTSEFFCFIVQNLLFHSAKPFVSQYKTFCFIVQNLLQWLKQLFLSPVCQYGLPASQVIGTPFQWGSPVYGLPHTLSAARLVDKEPQAGYNHSHDLSSIFPTTNRFPLCCACKVRVLYRYCL